MGSRSPVELAEGESVTVTPSDDNEYTVTLTDATSADCAFTLSVGGDNTFDTADIDETITHGSLEIIVVAADDTYCTFVTNANVFS